MEARDRLIAAAGRMQEVRPGGLSPEEVQRATVISLRNALVGDFRRRVLIVFGGVLLVLLTACANVTNLTLARSAARRRELAVMDALGAKRTQLLGRCFGRT